MWKTKDEDGNYDITFEPYENVVEFYNNVTFTRTFDFG